MNDTQTFNGTLDLTAWTAPGPEGAFPPLLVPAPAPEQEVDITITTPSDDSSYTISLGAGDALINNCANSSSPICFNTAITGQNIITSLWFNTALGIIMYLLFILFRAKFKLYQARLEMPQVSRKPPKLKLTGIARFYSWITPVFKVSDEDFLRSAGLDALVAVRIIGFGVLLFLPLTILGAAVLIPVNYFDDWYKKEAVVLGLDEFSSVFMRLTISNITPGSSLLWVHFVFVYVFVGWGCWLTMEHYKEYIALRQAYMVRATELSGSNGGRGANNSGTNTPLLSGTPIKGKRGGSSGNGIGSSVSGRCYNSDNAPPIKKGTMGSDVGGGGVDNTIMSNRSGVAGYAPTNNKLVNKLKMPRREASRSDYAVFHDAKESDGSGGTRNRSSSGDGSSHHQHQLYSSGVGGFNNSSTNPGPSRFAPPHAPYLQQQILIDTGKNESTSTTTSGETILAATNLMSLADADSEGVLLSHSSSGISLPALTDLNCTTTTVNSSSSGGGRVPSEPGSSRTIIAGEGGDRHLDHHHHSRQNSDARPLLVSGEASATSSRPMSREASETNIAGLTAAALNIAIAGNDSINKVAAMQSGNWADIDYSQYVLPLSSATRENSNNGGGGDVSSYKQQTEEEVKRNISLCYGIASIDAGTSMMTPPPPPPPSQRQLHQEGQIEIEGEEEMEMEAPSILRHDAVAVALSMPSSAPPSSAAAAVAAIKMHRRQQSKAAGSSSHPSTHAHGSASAVARHVNSSSATARGAHGAAIAEHNTDGAVIETATSGLTTNLVVGGTGGGGNTTHATINSTTTTGAMTPLQKHRPPNLSAVLDAFAASSASDIPTPMAELISPRGATGIDHRWWRAVAAHGDYDIEDDDDGTTTSGGLLGLWMNRNKKTAAITTTSSGGIIGICGGGNNYTFGSGTLGGKNNNNSNRNNNNRISNISNPWSASTSGAARHHSITLKGTVPISRSDGSTVAANAALYTVLVVDVPVDRLKLRRLGHLEFWHNNDLSPSGNSNSNSDGNNSSSSALQRSLSNIGLNGGGGGGAAGSMNKFSIHATSTNGGGRAGSGNNNNNSNSVRHHGYTSSASGGVVSMLQSHNTLGSDIWELALNDLERGDEIAAAAALNAPEAPSRWRSMPIIGHILRLWKSESERYIEWRRDVRWAIFNKRVRTATEMFTQLFGDDFDSIIPVYPTKKVDILIGRWDCILAKTERLQVSLKESAGKPAKVNKLKKKIVELQKQAVDLQQEITQVRDATLSDLPSTCFFATFKTQRAAAIASQANLNPIMQTMFRVIAAPRPDDVNWPTLQRGWWARTMRPIYVLPFIVAIMFLPIGAFTGAFAQLTIALCGDGSGNSGREGELAGTWFCSGDPWATFCRNVLTSVVPSTLLSIYHMVVLPVMIYYVAQAEGCHFSLSALDRRCADLFFYWDVFNVFLGAMLGGSLISELSTFLNDPSQIWLGLGSAIPASSNFFINYVAYRALVMAAFRLFYPSQAIMTAIFRWLRIIPRPKTARDRALMLPMRNCRYGRDVGIPLMMNYVMVLAYAVISPLILPFGLLYFILLWPVWRYQMLYVYQRQYESGGQFWPFVAHKVVGCNLIMVLFTGVVLLVKAAYTQGILMLVTLPIFLMRFDAYLTTRYDAVVAQVPLSALDEGKRVEHGVDSKIWTPPPLRQGAEGWHPQWGLVWQWWGLPKRGPGL